MTDDITVAYEVYQGRICLGILLFADEAVRLELHLAPVEGVKGQVADAAGAGPLRVKLRLRPLVAVVCYVGEDVRDRIGGANVPDAPVSGKPEGAAACRLVREVDGVTFGDEVGCPSWPPVWRIKEIGARLGSAGDEDDGKRWVRRGRVGGKLLDVDLPRHGH